MSSNGGAKILPFLLRPALAAYRPSGGGAVDYSAAIERARLKIPNLEAAYQRASSVDLRGMRLEEWRGLLLADPDAQPYLFERMLNEAYTLRSTATERALELTRGLLESIPSGRWPECLRADLSALAWSYIGNYLRILSRLTEAQIAFSTAKTLLSEGSADKLLSAHFHRMRSSLHRDLGLLHIARHDIELAVRIYSEHAHEQLPSALITLALIDIHEERFGDARVHLLRATKLTTDPDLLLFAVHNRAMALNYAGRHKEALRFLLHVRPLYRQATAESARMRGLWLEGQIRTGLNELAEAQALLEAAYNFFESPRLAFELAMCSLDLALVHLRQGMPELALARLSAASAFCSNSGLRHQQTLVRVLTAAATELTAKKVEESIWLLRRLKLSPNASVSV